MMWAGNCGSPGTQPSVTRDSHLGAPDEEADGDGGQREQEEVDEEQEG
jgi:hypothetical protein